MLSELHMINVFSFIASVDLFGNITKCKVKACMWHDKIWLTFLFPRSHFLSFCSPPTPFFPTLPSFILTPPSCIILSMFFLLFLHCQPHFASITAPYREGERMMLSWMQGRRWGGIIMQETEKLPVQPSSPPPLYHASRYRVHLSLTHALSHTHT